jgi:hypothetical protein
MHLKWAIVAAAAVVTLVSGCTNTESSRPAGADLIGIRDLPAGYRPVATGADSMSLPGIGSGSGLRGCPPLAGHAPRPSRSTAAVFSKGPTGPYVASVLLRYGNGGAKAVIETLDAARRHCRWVGYAVSGNDVQFRISTLRVPPMRDRVVPLHLSGRAGMIGIPVTANIVAVRRGGFVLVTAEFAVGAQVDGLAAHLAPLTVRRCAERVRGC